VPIEENLFVLRIRTLKVLSLGSAFAILNWIIGTRWAVAASSLFH
jgi:hypothetical protein